MKYLIYFVLLLLLAEYSHAQISGPNYVCGGGIESYTVTLNGGGIGLGTYSWTISNNAGTIYKCLFNCHTRDITFTTNPPSSAVITVTYTPSIGGQTETHQKIIYFYNAGVVSTSASNVCYSDNIQLSVSGQSGTPRIWQYKIGSGNWQTTPVYSNPYTYSNITQSTQFRIKVSTGSCGNLYSNVVTVNPYSILQGGSISGNQSICHSETASNLGNTSSASGGDGSYNYQWQRKVGSGSWTNVSGGTNTAYAPGSLTTTTQFQRRVSNTCGTKYSNTVTVTVYPHLNAGSISGNQSICSNATASTLDNSASASGGSGTYSYQWQRKVISGSWSNISGATAVSYSPGSLTVNTQYRRAVTNGCGTEYTNTVTVNLYASLLAGTIGGASSTICSNESTGIMTYSGSSGGDPSNRTEVWQYNDGSGWTDVSGAFSSTLSQNITVSTSYRVKVTSCGETVFSNPVIVNVGNHDCENYIITRQYRKAGSTGSETAKEDVTVSTTYFDGLAREKQTVIKQNSSLGIDLVQLVDYDQYGRISREYLPYAGGADGYIKPDPITDQANFYNVASDIAHDVAYANKIFETSPLSRVVEQGASGAAWQPGLATVTFDYEANIAADEVYIWNIDITTDAISASGHYPSGQLTKTVTTDEEGHSVIEFVNKLGQTVLKRVQAVESPNMTNYTLGEWADTYYVYDDFGNLRYVLPPEAVKEMVPIAIGTSFPYTPSSTLLARWAFQYNYDGRRRMTEKKMPGADWVYMVYDDRDRLVLTQDGEQRNQNQWLFTKYDALNRPVATGFYTNTTDVGQTAMQAKVNQYYSQLTSGQAWYESRGAVVHGYDNKSFPQISTSNEYLTVTYYDDYTFPHASGYPFVPELGNTSAFDRVKGQVTGTKTKTLDGSNTWLESVTYYDDRYRVIQSQSQTLIGGVDRVSNQYDFIGQVLETKTTHRPITIETVQWTDLVNITDNDGILTKTSGGNSWNGGAASVQSIPTGTNGSISFTANGTNTYRMIGLSTSNTNAHWNAIDYAIYLNNGILQIRESGSGNKLSYVRTYNDGDLFKIERLGNQIKYWHNDSLLREVTATYEALIIDLSVHSLGHTLNEILIQRATDVVSEENSITRKFEYDHAGRLLTTTHQINDGPEVIIAENNYNELGELIEKNLHSEDHGNTFAQSTDYRYNIRGWLKSINNAQLANTTDNDDTGQTQDYWGMELGYNHALSGISATPTYNGNISAVKWSDNLGLGEATNVKQRAYVYTYDPMNRIKTAGHRQYTSAWTANNHFQLSGLTYDLNGNIESLTRKDQQGANMDILAYSYSGNQLLSVADTGADGGFKDGTNGGDDYLYDDNGNMTRDENKDIGTITYNYLNLPQQVEKDANNYILYTYDAAGIKLRQEVYEAGAISKTTDYVGEFIYENNEIALIQHEEGRLVPTLPGLDPGSRAFEYQYYLKDHLGNTRVTFTTNPKEIEFTANYESNPAVPDDLGLFENVDNTTITSNDLFDHTDEAGNTYTNTQLLTGGLNSQVGSVIAIPVGMGDTLHAEVFAKYKDNTGNGNNSGAAIAGLLINAFTGGTGMTNELGNQSINNNFGSGSLIGTTGFAPENASAPMAFLNVMFLPEDETIDLEKDVSFAYDQIDGTAIQPNTSVKAAHDRMHVDNFVAPDQGYVLVYLSNESAVMTEVYFDDLKITLNEHPVIETASHYPFGLEMAGGFKRVTAKENKYNTFQGQERIDALDLGWYSFKWRNHDPTIGRFFNIDPLAESFYYNSTYAFSENRVVNGIELEGLEFVPINGKGIARAFETKVNQISNKVEQGLNAIGSGIAKAWGALDLTKTFGTESTTEQASGWGVTIEGESGGPDSKFVPTADPNADNSMMEKDFLDAFTAGAKAPKVNAPADIGQSAEKVATAVKKGVGAAKEGEKVFSNNVELPQDSVPTGKGSIMYNGDGTRTISSEVVVGGDTIDVERRTEKIEN